MKNNFQNLKTVFLRINIVTDFMLISLDNEDNKLLLARKIASVAIE